MEPILQLAQADLDEQDRENRECGREETRRTGAPRREVPEQEQERAAEDRDDSGMRVEDRLEARQPVHLRRSSTRMRPGCGCERAADEERQTRDGDAETEPPQLEREVDPHAPGRHLDGGEDQHDGPGEKQHRQQQVGGHNRPAQVGLDREVAEGRLCERSQEEHERELPGAAPERRPPRQRRDKKGDQDRDPADDAVPELDVGVVVLGR